MLWDIELYMLRGLGKLRWIKDSLRFQSLLQVLLCVYLIIPGPPLGMKYLISSAGLAAVQLVLQTTTILQKWLDSSTDMPYSKILNFFFVTSSNTRRQWLKPKESENRWYVTPEQCLLGTPESYKKIMLALLKSFSERGKKEIAAKLYYISSDIQTCTKQSMTNLCSSLETTEEIKHPWTHLCTSRLLDAVLLELYTTKLAEYLSFCRCSDSYVIYEIYVL